MPAALLRKAWARSRTAAGVAVQRRSLRSLLHQLLGVGDEVADQAAEEIVVIVQLP